MADASILDTIPNSFLNEFRDRIARGDLELPLLPTIAARMLEMISSDQGNAAELSDLIHRDQALASQVLRVANSSAFSRRGTIVSLKQAVTRLGTDLLAEIAIVSMLGRKIFRVRGHEERVSSIWRHALASGCFAKEIARLGRRNVESAFLCGLLHAIGKPIALNLAIELQSDDHVLSEEALEALIERTHQHVGVRIAVKWNLPEPIPTCILGHQEPERPNRFPDAVWTTYLSTGMASWLISDPEAEEDFSGNTAAAQLNLYPDDIRQILALRPQIEAFVDSLNQGFV